MRRALAACAIALSLGVTALPIAAAAAPPPAGYVPPVDAPVVDPFRPPAHPYGAGNRGLEYGTVPGTPVRATAAGAVTFAGLVAGTRHVTVLHVDGIRTSYSYLARVDVVVGQRVEQGQVVGTTLGQLHLGARLGDSYLDPASLFGARPPRVHLVPFDEPPGEGPAGERSALRQLLGAAGGLAVWAVDEALEGTGATVAWLRDDGPQLLRTAGHYLGQVTPGAGQLHLLLRGIGMWSRARAAAQRACTPPHAAVAPPDGRRVAVLVAGLGSTSEHAAVDEVDTAALGYASADVVRFSYAGGRTPDPTDGFTAIDARSYAAPDTQSDLWGSAVRLADLVERVAAAAPGLPIDVIAHSQGGVVARLALLELERRHSTPWLDRLGLLATLGTPHGGADLATAVHAVGSTRVGSSAFDALATALSLDLDDDAAAVAQLAETSDVVAELRATPVPAGVDAVTIAARGDLVVPVPRTVAPGAVSVVVPLGGARAHDALPGSAEAGRELALALAGLPPGCQSLRDAVVDQLVGEGISWAEDTAGALAWLTGLRRPAPLGG